MKVEIFNFSDGQKVNYPLVLLKGTIILDNLEEDESILNCCDNLKEKIQIFIRYDDGQNNSHESNESNSYNFSEINLNNIEGSQEYKSEEIPVIIVRRNFLFLAPLKLGVNTLEFIEKASGSIFHKSQLIYISNTNDFFIKGLYVFCSNSSKNDLLKDDNKSLDLDLKRSNLGLSIIQSLFSEKIYEADIGDERKTFNFNAKLDNCRTEIFKISKTVEEFRELDTKQVWELLAKEIRSSPIWNKMNKYVGYIMDPWKNCFQNKELKSHPALGGGGLAILYSLDFLKDYPLCWDKVLEKISDDRMFINTDGVQSTKTIGNFYGTTLGALSHEIGHIFDLGHTERGIMGSQYHRVSLSFSPIASYSNSKSTINHRAINNVVQQEMMSTVENRHKRPRVFHPSSKDEISEDCVSFNISSATLLYFHRWFRSYQQIVSLPGPTYNKNIITSEAGLTTVEIRDISNGLVVRAWVFDRSSNPTVEFILRKSYFAKCSPCDKAELVCQDLNGKILKVIVDRNSLPESFTLIKRPLF